MSRATEDRLALVASLAPRTGRADAARTLARDVGAEDLVIFVRDPEVNAHLPALGFPQTLPDGRRWRDFVRRSVAGVDPPTEDLPYPDEATVRPARALGCGSDAVLVLLGGRPRREPVAELCALLPMLAAAFVAERAALIGETHASLARARSLELEALARTVAEAQVSLQSALMEQRRLVRAQEIDARRKDEFLAVLAHELRNPLAALSSAAEVLRSAHLSAPAAAALDVVGRQARTLARLVDDLLDLSRITRGALDLRRTPVELAPIVEHALETAGPLLQSRRHQVGYERPADRLVVDGDAVRIEQIVLNLLSNAARYTPEGGHVRVSIERSGEYAEVGVGDDGVGIEADKLEHIFEMFAQARTEEGRAAGGLGIGLTISRHLAAMHGGSLRASSPGPGGGSEFVLTLPVSREEAAPVGARTGASEPQPASQRILVVDDNRDNAEMTAAVLQAWGHHVQVVFDAERALALTASERFEVVITDIGLPGLDGYGLAMELRARKLPVRIIALSGYGQQGDRIKSQAAGIDQHLLKPVDMDELRRSLSRS
jgi:signal transduction histidine kinase/CheY-like chemotaxis protein